jgi:protein-tyrosine-phosphatase
MEEFGASRDPREVLDCADALFVCTENAGRSQMAQALFECYAPEDLRAESAGLEPAAQINPTVIEAMKEIGIDISDRQPKKLTVEMQLHADLAVTLGCGGRCPYVPTHVEDWDLPDPAGRPLEEVRAIRDKVGGLVDDLIVHHSDEIRADRTTHELRLQKVLPSLIAEFKGMRTPQEIRECADAVLSSFDDARIRSHVPTLAERRTRDCLRADHCYELEDAR